MVHRVAAIAVCLLACSQLLPAQSAAVAVLTPRAFNERLSSDVRPVSGEVLVGLIATAPSVQPREDNLTVGLPSGTWTALNVRLTDSSGRYDASLEYDVTSVRPGLTRLRVPTKTPGILRSATATTLVSLAEISGPDGKAVVVTGWGLTDSVDQLTVLVNSRGWDTRLFLKRLGERDYIPANCDALAKDPSRIAFDTSCVTARGRAAEAEILIRRQRFEDVAADLRATLRLR